MGKGKKQGKAKKFVPLDINNLPSSSSKKPNNSCNTSTDLSVTSDDIKSSENDDNTSTEKCLQAITDDVLQTSDLSSNFNSFKDDESIEHSNNLIEQVDERVSDEIPNITNVLADNHLNSSEGERNCENAEKVVKSGMQSFSVSSAVSSSNIDKRSNRGIAKPFHDSSNYNRQRIVSDNNNTQQSLQKNKFGLGAESVHKHDREFEKRSGKYVREYTNKNNRGNETTKSQQTNRAIRQEDKQFRDQDHRNCRKLEQPDESVNVLVGMQKHQEVFGDLNDTNKVTNIEQFSPDHENLSTQNWDSTGQSADNENWNTESWDSECYNVENVSSQNLEERKNSPGQ